NVYEWCWDLYGAYPAEDLYPAEDHPSGPITGTRRVTRGGSWFSDGQFLRCASRSGANPQSANNYTGFRVVCP
ncbi:MAG: SUMF1/EgtB/PvdO family nonheme iron enzyme, partial [Treponema sp.]|nr:SUMF1/EgtB/PvdO family nonheme iron enzyme [Treponema sp.]